MKAKTIIILIAIIAAITLIWYFLMPVLITEPDKTDREILEDSILHYSKQQELHQDSADYYHERTEKATEEYLNLRPGSVVWDSLVADYTRNLEAKIRSGDTGLSSPLRAAQTGSVQPADGE